MRASEHNRHMQGAGGMHGSSSGWRARAATSGTREHWCARVKKAPVCPVRERSGGPQKGVGTKLTAGRLDVRPPKAHERKAAPPRAPLMNGWPAQAAARHRVAGCLQGIIQRAARAPCARTGLRAPARRHG
jgi:hypothetical protein